MSTPYRSVFTSPTYWLELAVGIGGITLAALSGRKAGSRGRRYEASEWVEFFTEPEGEVTPVHGRLRGRTDPEPSRAALPSARHPASCRQKSIAP